MTTARHGPSVESSLPVKPVNVCRTAIVPERVERLFAQLNDRVGESKVVLCYLSIPVQVVKLQAVAQM